MENEFELNLMRIVPNKILPVILCRESELDQFDHARIQELLKGHPVISFKWKPLKFELPELN